MIKYPQDFESSNEWTSVQDEEIQNVINSALDSLRKGEMSNYVGFFGDTMIYVSKIHEEDGGGFEVIVTSDYKQCYVDNKIFN